MSEVMITEENFAAEVLESKVPVLIDFYADWCPPCKMMSPVVAKIAEEYAGRVKVGKINSDHAPKLAQKYDIMSIPNFLFFKDGEVKDNVIGAVPATELTGRLDKLL